MQPAYITHAECAAHKMGVGHPERPERISAIHDRLLADGLLAQMMAIDAPLASREQLSEAHTLGYIDEIIAASPASGYVQLDPDTAMNSSTLQAALRAAGAAVLATDLVMQNKAPSAFCNVRPPGHHALRNQAMGFCFFNNVAVGIRHALAKYDLQRIALIDFDVHHGNGSEEIFKNDSRVLMCSIFEQGLYPFSGDSPLGKNMINIGLPKRSGGDRLRDAVINHWLPALDAFKPELIYISAGFDAHQEDDMANLGFFDADFEWATQQIMKVAKDHCQGRVISCLEGGYALGALARSAARHVRVLVEGK